MSFPFTKEGTLLIHYRNNEFVSTDVLKMIERGLIKAKAKGVTRQGRTIKFLGGIIRFFHGPDFLSSISSGEIRVEENDTSIVIHFNIRFTEMIVAVMVMVPFFALVLMLAPVLSIFQKVAILILFLGLGVSCPYILSAFRFPSFLRAIINRMQNKR